MARKTPLTTTTGRGHSGFQAVEYRDVNGKNLDVRVVSAGSGSGLKLRTLSGTARIIDNVQLSTAKAQTNVYWYPHG